MIFETEPLEKEGFPRSGMTYQKLLRTSNKDVVYYTARKSDSLMKANAETAYLYDVLMIKSGNREEMLTSRITSYNVCYTKLLRTRPCCRPKSH